MKRAGCLRNRPEFRRIPGEDYYFFSSAFLSAFFAAAFFLAGFASAFFSGAFSAAAGAATGAAAGAAGATAPSTANDDEAAKRNAAATSVEMSFMVFDSVWQGPVGRAGCRRVQHRACRALPGSVPQCFREVYRCDAVAPPALAGKSGTAPCSLRGGS